jgi:hypothetical protein
VNINEVLLGVLLVLASGLAGVGIWGVFEGVKTARSARVLADDLDARLVPLLDKADITVDALNAELLRLDAVITRVEEITDRVDSTSRTVQGVANAPAEIVTDIADRVRRAWKRRGAENAAEPAPPVDDEPEQPYEAPEAPVAQSDTDVT